MLARLRPIQKGCWQ
ncbi:hypothetical protein ACVRE7_005101 [Escherichia coli]